MTSRLLAAFTAAALLVPAALFAQTAPPPPPAQNQSSPPAVTKPAAPTATPTQPTPPAKTTPETAATETKVRDACRDDITKLCGTAKRGEVGACIRQNEDKLSAACKTAVAAAREQRRAQFAAACGADVKAHCAKETRGDTKVRECLQANEAKISAACKTQLASGRQNARTSP